MANLPLVQQLLQRLHNEEEGQGVYIGSGVLLIIIVVLLLLLLL